MSVGLCKDPGTYDKVMRFIFRLTWNIVDVFLDETLVMGKPFHNFLQNHQIVVDRFNQQTEAETIQVYVVPNRSKVCRTKSL